MIEQQIAFLQSQLETLRQAERRRKKDRKKNRSRRSSKSSVAAEPTPKPPRPPRPPKVKKEPEIREISFDEKRILSEAINNLSGEKLGKVVEIIHECMPQLKGVGAIRRLGFREFILP
jgi:bromodomain-containing factor 1